MENNKIAVLTLLACLRLPGLAQDTISVDSVDISVDRLFSRLEATSSVSTIYNKEFNKRSSKDIANSLLGQGKGLIALEGAGTYAGMSPTFYVRGLQSLSGSSPLIIIDGIERDMSQVSPDEVESVSILKDAAATALYGYKGANGVIMVTTKRGRQQAMEVNFTYDHLINWQERRPNFVNSYTYAQAMNEAYTNDGKSPLYSQEEVEAFKNGKYPYLYPNVNWLEETFRNTGISNKYAIEFRGGSSRLRYYSFLNLTTDKGFVKNANASDDYSTQNSYSRANLRTNLDVDLTSSTKLKFNILGVLTEAGQPGNRANLWDMIYTVPSAAFPVKNENGTWGGSTIWDGTKNPVAQSMGAAYTKLHTRALYADLTLSQDLSALVKGLSANVRVAYDNWSSVLENHSRTYSYGRDIVAGWVNGQPVLGDPYSVENSGNMSQSANTNAYKRLFNFMASIDYNHSFGKHDLYSQLRYEYEFQDSYGLNTTIYRLNGSWFTHYGFNKRFYADFALVASASNLLAPGHKWALSPTVSVAWLISNEKFLKNVSWINLLKLRASWGVVCTDAVPGVFNYWDQTYQLAGGGYRFDDAYTFGEGLGTTTTLSQYGASNSTHEKANKYNIGLDATLFKGLNLSIDGYYQRRSDIFVSTDGAYSDLLGLPAPYENAGIVDSWGYEFNLDYSRKIGEVTMNVGGSFTQNRTKIIEQREAPKLYPNLVMTGRPLNQTYGLVAIGFFKDQQDIANSPVQQFSTVAPGDIKYKDINNDGVIDANDRTAIGYSTAAPEIYYTFNLGAEWKGLGFNTVFQGTARYSAVLNTKSLYWPLINNTTISQYYYDNRWTTDHQDALFPRLSSASNANNYQTNTVWLANRSFLKLRTVELYYNLPKAWLSKTHIVNRARLYVRGVDLFSLDHIKIADPEAYGATTPLNRNVVIGVTVGF